MPYGVISTTQLLPPLNTHFKGKKNQCKEGRKEDRQTNAFQPGNSPLSLFFFFKLFFDLFPLLSLSLRSRSHSFHGAHIQPKIRKYPFLVVTNKSLISLLCLSLFSHFFFFSHQCHPGAKSSSSSSSSLPSQYGYRWREICRSFARHLHFGTGGNVRGRRGRRRRRRRTRTTRR